MSVRLLATLLAALILTACSQSRDASDGSPGSETDAPLTANDPAAIAFERRFNALQVRESELLPQLTAPGEPGPAAAARLQREAAAIIDALRALGSDPALSEPQRERVAREITNLETMVAMYLPAG